MCGILGTVNQPFDNSILELIRHRGPDDFGIEDYESNENKIQFGHRRLSIIDLSSAGHQPMNSEDKNYGIIFNGEIYNHTQLRSRLPSKINFKGHSDTETILNYLIEFGIESIKDFNGIFAIAFFNKIKKKLFLARDPFGVKPLYYNINENKIIFSSEVRPINAVINCSLNTEALATLLRLRYNPSPDTLYKGIEKVRPGHYIEADLSNSHISLQSHSFIEISPKVTNVPTNNFVRDYGEKLETAVKRQMLSDVEVGICLSGGIDSAVIAALAQKNNNGKLKAFTIGFEGKYDEDEIEDAAETAQILGLKHYFKKISFSDFLNNIKECSLIVEEPLATTSMIPMYYLSELVSEHVKVVLTGQGADEPLGGYFRYKSELIRDKIPLVFQSITSKLIQLNFKNEKISRGIRALGINNEINRFLSVYEVFTDTEIFKLINCNETESKNRISYFYDILDCKSKSHSVEKMMALDSRLNLADDLLNYTDKISMNFSLECRVPMLDLELVKFIESLPIAYKLNLKGGKLIHKQFAKTILPDKIINRKKKGFQSPTILWFREQSDIIKSILLKDKTNFSKVFNQSYVNELIEQHKNGYNKEKQIFLLLSIYYILESFSEKLI
ncbi:MAG TPA: asparagine synthase (glutamine-hydrolyzing) [Hanamia sp.]|nr:asparagine synthase (glutamine-hydrolyzing) [Hanamia sp.]